MPAGSRLTITTIGDDPRGAAIAAAAAANHLDLPGPVSVSDIAFVEGDLDDDERDRLAAFLADPLLQTATWDVPGDDDNAVEIAFHPGVTDAAADAIGYAATQLLRPGHGGGDRPARRVPAGLRPQRPSTRCCAGSSPTR